MVSRPITLLAVLFLCINLFSGLVMASGVGAMLGISANVGGDERVDESVAQAEESRTGSPTGSTLFGMYNVLVQSVTVLTGTITAGPTMLRRAGVPAMITTGILQPMFAVVMGIGVVSFLRGWDL
jgi:hypothetical protein